MGLFKAIFGTKEEKNKIINNEKFLIDFLKISDDKTFKNAEVYFPDNSKDIIINGIPQYFDPYYINEAGESSDGLYLRIFTSDFGFWIKPKDYKKIKAIMMNRRNKLLEERKLTHEKTKIEYMKQFEYDKIDNDIYKCFIAYKSGMTNEIGDWTNFRKVEDKLDSICKKNGGRYYKSEAKSAKFAIIFSSFNRTASTVNRLRDKGYKVTSFENMIEYFGLQDIWDTKGLIKQVKEQKEAMTKEYK